MAHPLAAEALMPHVRALAEEIGPRPAGHPAEMRARQYVRQALHKSGYTEVENLTFLAPDTWGYATGLPLALTLGSNLLPDRLLGGLTALAGGYFLWGATRIRRQPLTVLAPRRTSATLIVRMPPRSDRRQRLVLLGHVDANKDRLSFTPELKKTLLGLTTAMLGAAASNGIAQIAEALGAGEGARRMRKGSAAFLAASLLLTMLDERGDYVHGANDNATAVACLLGLADQLRSTPLDHTEIWLAFTGAEEVGCMGAHALLDAYGDELRDAWFLDLEMVGTEEIAYVTRHSGFSLLSTYRPDAASLAWAEETARRHPELGVTGREMVIGEEVGTLRGRDYRGICLAGVGEDGWLAQWHQASDNVDNVVPAGLEKAARFAWAMMETLDSGV